MAYMSQEHKKELLPNIKAILAKYKIKGSVAVRHHSSLVLNIKSGAIDFIGSYNEAAKDRYQWGELVGKWDRDYMQVNENSVDEWFEGNAKSFLTEMVDAMNGEGTKDANFDDSDAMTDYFHRGWYIDINIGKWNKPYAVNEA